MSDLAKFAQKVPPQVLNVIKIAINTLSQNEAKIRAGLLSDNPEDNRQSLAIYRENLIKVKSLIRALTTAGVDVRQFRFAEIPNKVQYKKNPQRIKYWMNKVVAPIRALVSDVRILGNQKARQILFKHLYNLLQPQGEGARLRTLAFGFDILNESEWKKFSEVKEPIETAPSQKRTQSIDLTRKNRLMILHKMQENLNP